MALKIQLLGGFAVYRNDELIEEWGSEQTKTLLKILCSEPDMIFLHDQLIEHLWPDTEFDRALSFLRARIHNLRQVLEPEAESSYRYIQTCPGGYRFKTQPDCEIDTMIFSKTYKEGQRAVSDEDIPSAIQHFKTMLDLYRGIYLPEDRYEEWSQLDRGKWQDLHVASLVDLADCYALQRQFRKAVELCRNAYAIEPYKEDLYRQAMVYCYLMGNSNDAMRIFDHLKSILDDELRLEPDHQTEELRQQIAAGFVPGVDKKYEKPPIINLDVGPHIGRLPFAGRLSEFKALLNMLGRVRASTGQMALVGGEIGIGKTRLVQELALLAELEYGFTSMMGRFTELAMMSPYQTLLESLKSALSILSAAKMKQLPRLSSSVLSTWLPGIEFPSEQIETLPKLDPEKERLRFFEALTQMILSLSELSGPIILILDDIQWADASTIDFLDFLIPRISNHKIFLIGTYRAEEIDPAHPLQKIIRLAKRQSISGSTLHIKLQELNAENILDLLERSAQHIDDQYKLSEYLYKESGGNPLFLVSLLQTLIEEQIIRVAPNGDWLPNMDGISEVREKPMPREIQEMIEARIERIDDDTRRLLECASVIGLNQDKELLEALWLQVNPEESEFKYTDRIETLEKMQILARDSSEFHFTHDKIREVVYGRIHADRAMLLHRSVAELLEDRLATTTDRPHELFAYHYRLAGLAWEAVLDLLPAVKNAVSGYQNHEGLQLATNALELITTIDPQTVDSDKMDQIEFELLEQRINLLDMLAQRDDQRSDLERLFNISEGNQDPTIIAQSHLLMANLEMRISAYESAHASCYKALQIGRETENNDLIVRALHSIAQIMWHKGDYDEAFEYFNDELKVLEEIEDPSSLAQTLHYLGQIAWHRGQYEESERFYIKALEIRENTKEVHKKAFTLSALGLMYSSTEQFQKAIETLEEVTEIASSIGDRRGQSYALGNLGLTCMDQGAYDLAIEYLETSVNIQTEIGDRRNMAITLNNLGRVNLRLGRRKEAKQLFEQVMTISKEIDLPDGLAYAQHNLAMINLMEQKFDAAEELLENAMAIYQESKNQSNIGSAVKDRGEIALQAGKIDDAIGHFNEALIFSRALKSRSGEMMNHTNLARCYLQSAQLDKASKHSESALQILDSLNKSPHAPTVWFTHYEILKSIDAADESKNALTVAHDSLLDLAEQIDSETLRSSFLKKISIHQQIIDAFGTSIDSIDLSEESCYDLLRETRWHDNVFCPYCACTQTRIHGHVSKSPEKRYLCTDCGKTFGDRTGTVFANSNLSMAKLFQALIILENMSDAASAKKSIAENLSIHPRTASNLHQKLAGAASESEFIQELIERLFNSD